MESNLDCNHTNNEQNRTTVKWESDLLITRYQLVKTMTKFEKETRHRLYVFIETKNNSLLGEMRDNSAHMTRSVHSHRHDALTVPFNGPITLFNYNYDAYTVRLVIKSAG